MRFLTIAAVLFPLVAGADIKLPDATKGQINGHLAVVAVPVSGVETVEGAGARYDALLSSDDCQTHLSPIRNLEQELRYPCGAWFQPPAIGNYRIWLEMPNLISEGYGILNWENDPFTGRGISMAMGMEPAGKVALASQIPLSDAQTFRFVHLRTVHKGVLQAAFDRRLPGERAHAGAQVASGTVVAGVFDRKTDDAVMLTRPLEVKPGKLTYAAPSLPKKGSDLLVVLSRPVPVRLGGHEVAVTLQVDDKTRKPDVLLPASSTVFAIWYGVEGRAANLVAESPTVYLPATPINLRPGKAVTLRTKLMKRPSIAVSIGGPEDVLRDRHLSLELRAYAGDVLVHTVEARPNADFSFESLAADMYDVVLRVDDWELRKHVDLTTGADERVIFTLSPIVVSGTVYYGRDPAAQADVAFDIGPAWIRTTADDQGRYELVLWKPGDYVAEITLPDRAGPPFWDMGSNIRESETLDFHVPNTHFTVNVRDAVTGKPIEGAKVLAGSIYNGQNGEGRVTQTAVTDEKGRALLPPMRVGGISVRARAEGYFDSDVTNDAVRAVDATGSFEIELRPVGDTVPVTIRMPDGSNAAGAQVWAVRSTGGHDRPLWNGTADEHGVVAIPRSVRSAFFLVRANNAAAAVRQLAGNEEALWSLAPSAPLTVHVGSGIRIAVWIDEIRVSGLPLALLLGTLEATDDDGNWSASLLPRRPLRVLAWRSAPAGAVETGAYDIAATQLPYPWPRLLELHPVD
jgi:hypothetical protein